jgi:hypothetical protein
LRTLGLKMQRPRLITVRGKTMKALQAAAAARTSRLTRDGGCERVLVVYGPHAARLYVEGQALDRPLPDRGHIAREAR